MRGDLAKLLDLQNWDLETARLEQELSSFPSQREVMVEEVLSSRKRADSLKEKLAQSGSMRRDIELQINQQEQNLSKFSAQQMQTRKNDEYKAFESQMEATRGIISDLETRLLEMMEKEDLIRQQYEEVLKEKKRVEKRCKEQIIAIDARKQENLKLLEKRREHRKRFADQVPAALRIKYERMIKNKKGHVLVGIDGGACRGCHIKLPQQLVLSCKSEEQEVICINCGRLLYYSSEMKID